MATNSSGSIVERKRQVIVAVIPWIEYSHVNQLFILARFIASQNIAVHFLCLPDRNRALKLQLQSGLKASGIHFHDLVIPTKTEDTGDDDDLLSIAALLNKLGEPISTTCLELSAGAKKLVIIYDSMLRDFMGDVHSFQMAESYVFHTGSAFTKYSLLRQVMNHISDEDHDRVVQELQEEYPLLDSIGASEYIPHFIRMDHEWKLNSGEFINSSREVEGKYLDLLAKAKDDKPLWALGPLNMLLESSSSDQSIGRHECLEFLDKHHVNSVVFVSFGTTTTLSQEQINEMALGLERSNHRFIWVLRKANERERLEERDGKIELPQGFEERVEGRGMVVRKWAPQSEILGHPSTGGFLSHCGWNSCLESMSMGVPLATWPIIFDQPYNAIVVTNLLKIGISVRSWTRRDELVTAASIEKAIKTLMGTTQGEEMRKRAVELSGKIKSSVSRGGHALKEMESFISHIIK